MRPLPAREPDTDRRWMVRVAPDPYPRFDTDDYSLDPSLIWRRIEVRATQCEITAVVRDTGELAWRHQRSFAKHCGRFVRWRRRRRICRRRRRRVWRRRVWRRRIRRWRRIPAEAEKDPEAAERRRR
jgi:hypothetical protein